MNKITKDNPNRWFYVMDGEDNLVVFGYAGNQGDTEVSTGQPTINSFLTEDELEIFINEDVGLENYYKDAVENDSTKFQGPSSKYDVVINEEEDEE
tara:strand:+ start:979 stop:1266 length:288 start_codon:yes stop_codon:yes gene_type:complete